MSIITYSYASTMSNELIWLPRYGVKRRFWAAVVTKWVSLALPDVKDRSYRLRCLTQGLRVVQPYERK